MNAFPTIDYASAWASLPAETQARIGALAIEASLLLHASNRFQGDEDGEYVVYLDDDDRDEANLQSGRALSAMDEVIHPAFPDLFGEYPSDEHPNGTDPTWATPLVRKVADLAEIILVSEAA